MLVARRTERLEELSADLRASHGVGVETIPADLARPGAGRELSEEVDRRGLRVTGLVNNAGVGADGAFHDQDPVELQRMLALNVSAVVDVSRAFVGRLTERPGGYLVNVASMAAYQPIPGMAVYAASKAFVLDFTEALWWETRGSGLRTMAFSPGLTRTEFFDGIGDEGYPSSGFQTPEQVATALVRALDRRRSAPSALSRPGNVFATALTRFLSRRAAVSATAVAAGSAVLMGKTGPVLS